MQKYLVLGVILLITMSLGCISETEPRENNTTPQIVDTNITFEENATIVFDEKKIEGEHLEVKIDTNATPIIEEREIEGGTFEGNDFEYFNISEIQWEMTHNYWVDMKDVKCLVTIIWYNYEYGYDSLDDVQFRGNTVCFSHLMDKYNYNSEVWLWYAFLHPSENVDLIHIKEWDVYYSNFILQDEDRIEMVIYYNKGNGVFVPIYKRIYKVI